MDPPSLEQLPDETIVYVISQLSLWDAFALEATNKRMHGLVRAHQKVQTSMDITFPMNLLLQERVDNCREGIEHTILTRFGPKLRKIKEIKESEEEFYAQIFNDENFMQRLAIACPNLIWLPTYNYPIALVAYVASRSVALKKIVMRSEVFRAGEVEQLLMNSPQLEDLAIYAYHRIKSDNCNLLKAVEASVPVNNKIRKLHLHFGYSYGPEGSVYQVIERIISKLPHLEHFKIRPYFNGIYSDEHSQSLTNLFAKTNCSNILELPRYVILYPTLAVHVASLSIGDTVSYDFSYNLRKFAKLRRLEIDFDPERNEMNRPALTLPETVRELIVHHLSKHAEVTSLHQCIRNQGRQLESVSLNYFIYGAPNDDKFSWTNQLLVSISESLVVLKSLCISNLEYFPGFESEHLRNFLKTFAKTLEHFHVDKQLLSLSTLEFMSAECKALKSLKFCFAIENAQDDSQINQLGKLFKGMSKLYEANVTARKYIGSSDKWDVVAECEYVNHKFIVRRCIKKKYKLSKTEKRV